MTPSSTPTLERADGSHLARRDLHASSLVAPVDRGSRLDRATAAHLRAPVLSPPRSQWRTPRDVSPDSGGVRALYARLLWYALVEAGLAPRRYRTRPARSRSAGSAASSTTRSCSPSRTCARPSG
jgi:hypothetical protein